MDSAAGLVNVGFCYSGLPIAIEVMVVVMVVKAMVALPLLLTEPCLMPKVVFPALAFELLAALAFVELVAVAVVVVMVDDVGGLSILERNRELLCLGRGSAGK
jgi:hypothetical protein